MIRGSLSGMGRRLKVVAVKSVLKGEGQKYAVSLCYFARNYYRTDKLMVVL